MQPFRAQISRTAAATALLSFVTSPASSQTNLVPHSEEKLARLLAGFSDWAIECKEGTYAVSESDGSVEFCLPLANPNQVRCEVALHVPDTRDKAVNLSYEIMTSSDWPMRSEWTIVTQIASPPDIDEAWRCPLLSLETVNHTFRMFSRWDVRERTDTSKSTCAGGSIRTNKVFEAIPFTPGVWVAIRLNIVLSLSAGNVEATIDGKTAGRVRGPTTYNDRGRPYIKFGVYKPHPRSNGGTLCAHYRNIRLSFDN